MNPPIGCRCAAIELDRLRGSVNRPYRSDPAAFVLREVTLILDCERMIRKDDFDYAIENTQVIVAPERQIATFGSTSFNFYLISELMDRVDQIRIRNGKIHAERPQILTPEHYCRLLLEGFG